MEPLILFISKRNNFNDVINIFFFFFSYPFVCVSIALVKNKRSILGVVFNPILNELFYAIRGRGAFLNEKAIHVSKTTDILHSVVGTNVGYDRTEEGIRMMIRLADI